MFFNSHVNGSIYLNDVSDYVTTYRVSDGTYDNSVNDARVYKNVDATIWGYELSVQNNISNNLLLLNFITIFSLSLWLAAWIE